MREKFATADVIIAEIAARQHGVVTTEQLNRAGIDRNGISRRVAAGRLHRIYRGVYAVGHPGLSSEGEWMAAVLACGPDAVLSYVSAARLWKMLKPGGGPIDVTIPSSSGRARRDRIRLHRSTSMPRADTTCENRIPVTTPARTLADLKRVVSPGLHRTATRQAEFQGFDLGEIETDGTRSELERVFLRLCRKHRFPMPLVNARIGPYTVDFYWPEQGLVVETDAYATHAGRQAFEDDRNRDLYLSAQGLTVRRFTDTQIYGQPKPVTHAVRQALASSSRYPRESRQFRA
jgi:very-short-patch-repair endonuclease